jgi:type IV pilus assembly protein PilM
MNTENTNTSEANKTMPQEKERAVAASATSGAPVEPERQHGTVPRNPDIADTFYESLPFIKRMEAKKVLSLDVDIDKVRYVITQKAGNHVRVIRWGVQKFPGEEKNLMKALQIALENIRARVYQRGMEIVVSVFSPDISIRQVVIPRIANTSDLEKALFFKNQGDLQGFDESSVWSWKIVEEFEEDNIRKQRVLITVVPARTVQRYLEIFDNARMVISSMVPHQAAILGAYTRIIPNGGNDLLIDISYDHTQICFIKNGRLEYIRNIGIGARNLEVMIRDGDGAEDSDSISLQTNEGETAPISPAGLRSRLREKVKDLQQRQNPVLHTFFSEIMRSMAFIQGKENNDFIERVMLTGYGLRKESLIPYLRSRIKLPILILSPQFSDGASRSLEYGEFFSTVGAVLESGKPYNILPKRYQFRTMFRKANTLLSVLIVTVAAVLAYFSFLQNQIIRNHEILLVQNRAEYEKLNPVEGMYKKLVNQISQVNEQNRELHGYVDKQPPMIEVLRLFSNETPETVIFKKMHFYNPRLTGKQKDRKNAAEGEYWVDVEGIIKSDILIGDVILINFINKLNGLSYFKNIQLNYTQKKPDENQTMFGFRAIL